MTSPEPDIPDGPLVLEPGTDFVPAPLPTRLVAYLLDVGATAVMLMALDRFVQPQLARLLEPGSTPEQIIGLSLVFIVTLGYWVVVTAVSGATAGKQMFGLRIVPVDDRSLGLGQVILREVVGHALHVATLGLGFISGLSDDRQRGLNDRIAGTRIVLFTPRRSGVYRVQDLRTVDAAGTLQSDEASGPAPSIGMADVSRQAAAAATGESGRAPAVPGGPAVVEPPVDAPAPSSEAGVPETAREPATPPPGAAPTGESGRPAAVPPVAPAPPAPGKTLYARPEGETAYERRMRAALGPGIPELIEALRRTAGLVADGSLMPKFLDRKKAEFIEQLGKADLGPDPQETIRAVAALARDAILSREELEQARDVLRTRFSG